jgi:predicted metal-binding membrane protein
MIAGTALQRDRVAVLFSLLGITALSWIYLIRESVDMSRASPMMDMVRLDPWGVTDFGLTFAMWAIIMVGMTVPSAAPAALVYAGVARKAARQGAVVAPALVFVAGYVSLRVLFSGFGTLAQ